MLEILSVELAVQCWVMRSRAREAFLLEWLDMTSVKKGVLSNQLKYGWSEGLTKLLVSTTYNAWVSSGKDQTGFVIVGTHKNTSSETMDLQRTPQRLSSAVCAGTGNSLLTYTNVIEIIKKTLWMRGTELGFVTGNLAPLQQKRFLGFMCLQYKYLVN